MKQNTHLLAQVEISAGAGGSHSRPRSRPHSPLEHHRARAAAPVDVDRELLLAGLDVEVDQVAQRLAVHPQEPVARPETGPRGQPLRLDRQHPHPGLGNALRHQRPPQST